MYPEIKVYVMGVNESKLNDFTFADGTYSIHEIPADFTIDHAFECVGGNGAHKAINQIIDYINPEGTYLRIWHQSIPVWYWKKA